MNKKQKKFIAECIAHFAVEDQKKFKEGQDEHKGNFWEKSGLLNEAKNEALDLWNYLYTHRLQLGELYETIDLLNAQELNPTAAKLARKAMFQLIKLLATKCI